MTFIKKIILLFCFLSIVSCDKSKIKDSKIKEQSIQKINSSRSPNVSILKDSFAVENLQGKLIYRKIWLYTPPNYKKSTESYPVIYMHDGQNLFDKETSFVGEWGVDEILNSIFEKTGKGFIVVGIDNVGSERTNEYSPWTHKKYGGGNGDRYLKMIVEELKPMIDKNYRTKTKKEHTGIIGSSMGGLISYYGGLKHLTVFGKIGVISPSFWFSKNVLSYTKNQAKEADNKMFFLLGAEEGMTKEFSEVSNLLVESGFKKESIYKKLVPGGKHNEAFWGSQFEEVISWLYNIQ